ncbi:PDR/VanB family oxidoreductase [Undibacterium sp.]|uniref:PDR/VanB family oxidoreductase n=1 Tax=Undibacterium sp. TaxID=1914977 RepID=UPI00374D671F
MHKLPEILQVRVAELAPCAEGVVRLTLEAADGGALPAFSPGAHIDVYLGNGLVRQYSLSNFQPAPYIYEIAVGMVAESRGGSRYVHEAIRAGHVLGISTPRNNFALAEEADVHIFIAGGIGITPILSMLRWCELHGKQWRLLYAAKSRRCAAYLDQLEEFDRRRLHLHFDDEHSGYADLVDYLALPQPGSERNELSASEHIYCCGPELLMKAVELAAAGRTAGTVHFERFSAPVAEPAKGVDAPFILRLKRSGMEVPVEADTSILQALENAGVALPFSCREGLCRSCETAVCSGVPEHRDYVLSDAEQASNKTMMVCVSRSRTPVLELDI